MPCCYGVRGKQQGKQEQLNVRQTGYTPVRQNNCHENDLN